jgi:hypothetical protein
MNEQAALVAVFAWCWRKDAQPPCNQTKPRSETESVWRDARGTQCNGCALQVSPKSPGANIGNAFSALVPFVSTRARVKLCPSS